MTRRVAPAVVAIARPFLVAALVCGAVVGPPRCFGQDDSPRAAESPRVERPDETDLSAAPTKVDVQPVARDEEIRQRLEKVLRATRWFVEPRVRVEEGVVFLTGRTDTEELRKWAGDLARSTQDVVAVANRIEVVEPSLWDFSATWNGLFSLWRDLATSLPLLVFGLVILGLSAGLGWLATRVARAIFRARVQSKLLLGVIAFAAGAFVFLAGIYVVLRVSGLTQLALTVVGGTGLVGLAVGIAFRDITENFLASIFLSMQRPFATGDLVEVAATTGYVQQLNVRTTVLMTLDGNVVQIPNATVYKSTIRNFTVNPNRREAFVVGVGYDDAIDEAQEVALRVLAEHPAVLEDPEPWVLVDSLGKSSVELKIYFWLDGREYSWLKVRSSVIRLVKRAFQEHGISMPDEAREVVFPKGVPVTVIERREAESDGRSSRRVVPIAARGGRDVANKAEGGLVSEADVLQEQARQSQPLGDDENLLRRPK